MIFPAMMFLLGFLSAGLLALLIFPPVIRRANNAGNKRRKLPQNIQQAEASKDRLRAEFAVSLRKQEHSIEKLKQRAQAYLIEIAERNVKIRSMKKEMQKITDLADRRYKDKKDLRYKLENLQKPETAKKPVTPAATKSTPHEKDNIRQIKNQPVRLPGTAAAKKTDKGALASRIQKLKNLE